MTTTAEPTTLPACPDWCTHNQPKVLDHSYMDEDAAGWPMRKHTIEYPTVEAGREVSRQTGLHPDVFVCLMQPESVTPEGLSLGEFEIGLAADEYPHLTAGEARRVAAMLTAAADKLDELEGLTPRSAGPDPADVEAVRGLLEMMNRTGFASDDQRARYLLSSNWLRDRGPAAARRLQEGR